MRQFDQTLRQLDEALTERVPAQIAALETAERRPRDASARRLRSEMLRDEVFGAIAQMTDTLAHELNQPLAAASFLVKAAGLRLAREASEDINAARADLDEAATQILQVGRIIRGLRDHFAEQRER
jgi:two-component system, LuxR family, sensor kinase FixL